MAHRGRGRTLDLAGLPPQVRHVLEDLVTGREVTLVRGEHELGTLEFRATALEGVVLERTMRGASPEVDLPEGVTVVATAMRLSAPVRARLSEELGEDYIVLDLHDAPETTDVVLVNPVSTRLIGYLQLKFPQARVVVTEIEDDELGVTYAGPVGRLLDAGVAAYLPPRPLPELARGVRAYLDGTGRNAIEAADAGARPLSAPER